MTTFEKLIHKTYGYTSILLPILLIAVTFSLTLPFRPEEFIRDSLVWARMVEDGHNLFNIYNPHHLIYLPINLAIFRLLEPFCSQCTGVDAGLIHTLIGNLVLSLSIYFIVKALTKNYFYAFTLPILFLVTKSTWIFALQPQSYSPTLAVISLLLLSLVTYSQEQKNITRDLLISTLLSLAILYHQAFVIFCIPLSYYLIHKIGKGSVKPAVTIIGISGFFVLSIYILVYLAIYGEWTPSGFVNYLTRYSSMADPNYFSFSNFSLNGVSNVFHSQLSSIITPSWSLRLPTLAIFIIFGFLVLASNIYFISSSHSHLRILLISWYFCFFLVLLWGNGNDDAWPLLFNLPLFILVTIAIKDISSQKNETITKLVKIIISIFIFIIGARNLQETIIPMHLSKGKHYEVAERMHRAIEEDCDFFEPSQKIQQNLVYYFDRKTKDLWDIITFIYHNNDGRTPFTWQDYQFNKTSCHVVPSLALKKEFTAAGISGNTNPEKWKRYLAWLFDIKSTQKDQIQHREFKLVEDENLNKYIVIYNKLVVTNNFEDFSSRLLKLI